MITDTHCHLKYDYEGGLAGILERAKVAKVDRLITIATSKEELEIYKDFAENNNEVYYGGAIHPHDASSYGKNFEETVIKHFNNKKFVAYGEIGLDFHYNYSPKEIQMDVFKKQLELSKKLNKPIVIHSREAENETIEILDSVVKGHSKIVIHCFSGSLEFAKKCIERNYFLSFSGIITFKTANEIRESLKITPNDKIIIETDSPYLAPIPFRGKQNEPSYVPYVLEMVAKTKLWTRDEAINIINSNTNKLFFEDNL